MWLCRNCGEGEMKAELAAPIAIDRGGVPIVSHADDYAYVCDTCGYALNHNDCFITDIAVWQDWD